MSSTIIALLGFGLATLGFYNGDSFASIFLGSMLIYLSIKLARASIMELSDATSKEMTQKIEKAILSEEGVLRNQSLRARLVGHKTFIETTVQVSEVTRLDEAHTLASRIEGKLTKALGNVDATIHIEPSERETSMEKLVEKLATVEGVLEVHDIATVYAGGQLYITLHAIVDSKLSVEEAHDIVERIEKRMHNGIENLENVTVPVEPYGEAGAAEINENELRKIIQKVAKDVERNVYVKRIVTYAAEGKRYINMDCCFTKQVSITEAHEIASRIEEEIRERFADALVTVHMEPDYA